uniref:Chitin-binding type-2 domain-containing protein n=1 Tax=Anopheles farauti TaxID=69004 RepID=A0A1Y9H9N1_9DIPT
MIRFHSLVTRCETCETMRCRGILLCVVCIALKVVLVRSAVVPSLRAAGDKCESGKRQGCADCRTVNICSYDQTVLTSYKCQDVEPDKPYCTGDGICSSEYDSESTCGVADDLCPSTKMGFYPDPSNCTQYLYCDDKQVATTVSCLAANNAYNHSSSSCFLRKTLDDCYQVSCDSLPNRNKWFVYRPFPQLYFFCSSSGRPVMFECPRITDVYDVKLQRCKFECRESGRFPYPEDNKKFYECVYVTPFKLELFVQRCPLQLTYDEEKRICTV